MRQGVLIAAVLLSMFNLFGCKRETAAAPHKPGVSEALRYPVLLIGQASLDVRDSEQALIAIRGASSLNLVERVVLDSNGDLFKVTEAAPIAGQPSTLWSMGTSDRLFSVTVAKQPRPAWPEVQKLVLEQISAPNSTLQGSEKAAARVKGFATVAELIEASRESWNWGN